MKKNSGPEKNKKSETLKLLSDALLRIKHNRPRVVSLNRKLSIASVAEEAGLSRATIHNHYPSIADEIKRLTDNSIRTQNNKNRETLASYKNTIRELRNEIKQLKQDKITLASINESLELELQESKRIKKSTNISYIDS